ncbi:MAG: DUF4326 domain-containing protein [Nanoarchaeota archaeon]
MIKVIHKKHSKKYENVFYIGRGSPLGNPYTSIQGRETLAKFVVSSREESIELYRTYLLECIEKKDKEVCDMLNSIYKLAVDSDVYLSCYCSPKSCHGDVVKEIIESFIKKKNELNNDGIQLSLFD